MSNPSTATIAALPAATEASVQNATQLAKHINDGAKNFAAIARALPNILTPNLTAATIKKQTGSSTITASTTYYLQHGLSRPYVGYIVTRQTAGGVLIEEALKTGQSKSQFIALQPTVTGIYDILVF